MSKNCSKAIFMSPPPKIAQMSDIVYQPSFLQSTLKKSVTFSIPGASDLRLKTIDYFSKSNFRQTSALTDKKISFRRGSLLTNMVTFNPLKWKSEIQIDIQGQEVSVELRINTFAQLSTPKEAALWDDFIKHYEAYLTDSRLEDHLSNNAASLKAVKKNNYRLMGWFLIGGMIAAIPATLLAIWTGVGALAPLGATLGGMYYLNKKNEEEKKKMS